MEFDFEKFLDRLQAKALSKQDAAKLIYKEIRDAENQKVGFLDQSTENADFYKYIGSQIDAYIAYLKVLHHKIDSSGPVEPDEQVYETDMAIITRTLNLVKHLEQLEKSRGEDKTND